MTTAKELALAIHAHVERVVSNDQLGPGHTFAALVAALEPLFAKEACSAGVPIAPVDKLWRLCLALKADDVDAALAEIERLQRAAKRKEQLDAQVKTLSDFIDGLGKMLDVQPSMDRIRAAIERLQTAAVRPYAERIDERETREAMAIAVDAPILDSSWKVIITLAQRNRDDLSAIREEIELVRRRNEDLESNVRDLVAEHNAAIRPPWEPSCREYHKAVCNALGVKLGHRGHVLRRIRRLVATERTVRAALADHDRRGE